MNDKLLNDMIKRMKGEFYIGVVGSVRSGKSLFIKKFMEIKVLPYVTGPLKDKITDELPQSAQGKTIMTVEPKFVPSNETEIMVGDMKMKVRLVDSVGYIIPNALGHYTETGPRLVKTPWFNDPIPFKEASVIGTKKVITNHSTLGIVMTSDGSINEFKREDFEAVEDDVINELKALDKPFVIVVNSANPNAYEAKNICSALSLKYETSVIAMNVLEMKENDIDRLLQEALNEFPISELNIKLPSYINLNDDNDYANYANNAIKETTENYKKFKDIENIKKGLLEFDQFKNVVIEEISPEVGSAVLRIDMVDGIYEKMLNDLIGEIEDKGEFISKIAKYKKAYEEYEKIKPAMEMVDSTGYGIAYPKQSEMILESPTVINQGQRYGLRIKATAPSLHLIKVNVDSVFEPIIGSEEQSKKLLESLKEEKDIWDLEIFGRSLCDCLNDGIKAKMHLFPERAKEKLRLTLEKIINNNTGGMIAIIL